MSPRYENAPLVEVIAELRWITTPDLLMQQAPVGAPVQIPASVNQENEAFFSKAAQILDEAGFRTSERIAPIGAVPFPGEPVIRFRERSGYPPLLQLGGGLFSANGLPPTYEGWNKFLPTVSTGVEAVLKSRGLNEQNLPFTVSLRYIDAFPSEYWEGRSAGEFISEVLGFSLNLPAPLMEKIESGGAAQAAHQFNIPLSDGSRALVNVGEGQHEGAPAVILDMIVQRDDVGANLEAVLDVLEKNHALLSEAFRTMTSNIEQLMSPVGDQI